MSTVAEHLPSTSAAPVEAPAPAATGDPAILGLPIFVVGSVTAFDVADHFLTGGQIKSSTLGTVPNAAHASSADHATNADNLGGSPASDFRLHCPDNLHRGADLCFDFTERAASPLATALATCARAKLRLPSDGEMALVFDNLAAVQDFEWVADHYFLATGPAVGGLLAQDVSRQILFNAGPASMSYPYRCVTSASN
jgi:hypothetical protein